MKHFLFSLDESKFGGTATVDGLQAHMVGTGKKYDNSVFISELDGNPRERIAQLEALLADAQANQYYLDHRLQDVEKRLGAALKEVVRLQQEWDALGAAYTAAIEREKVLA